MLILILQNTGLSPALRWGGFPRARLPLAGNGVTPLTPVVRNNESSTSADEAAQKITTHTL